MEQGICTSGEAARMFSNIFGRVKRFQSYTLVVGSSAAFVMLIVALFTDHWLSLRAVWAIKPHSGEMLNGYELENVTEFVQREKKSFSGLWRICCGEDDCLGNCRSLKTSKDSQTSTSSLYVIGVLRRTNVFPVVSVLLAFSGALFLAAGLFWKSKHHVLSLASGVNLVVSGLTNVLGIIIFISSNDKLRKRKSSGTEYDWSFYCAGMAFVLSEILGVIIIQELVKSVETSNGEKNEVDSNIEEEVSRTSSIVAKGKGLTMPPSVNLRRSVRRKSRVSMCYPENGVCDIPVPGATLEQNSTPYLETPDELASVRIEPAKGLPCSDSGYNGASSFNLRESASSHKDMHSYAGPRVLEPSDIEDESSVEDNVYKLNQINLPSPYGSPLQSPVSYHSPLTRHTESTLSFPPPAEFQNVTHNSNLKTPSTKLYDTTLFCVDSLSGTRSYPHTKTADGERKKPSTTQPQVRISRPKDLRLKITSGKRYLTRKVALHEETSFDSNLASPVVVRNGVESVDGRVSALRTRTERQNPNIPLRLPGSDNSPMFNTSEYRITGKDKNPSPAAKPFRPKLFSKQNWIKSRNQVVGQSGESDDFEMRTVDRVTDSGYRSGGASSDGKGTRSLPRIARSQTTFPDEIMQITRYDHNSSKGVAISQYSRPNSAYLVPKCDRNRQFTSSNSSLTHAIRRSSSTGFLCDPKLGQRLTERQAPVSRINYEAFVGPDIWQGPVTAL